MQEEGDEHTHDYIRVAPRTKETEVRVLSLKEREEKEKERRKQAALKRQ